MAGPYRGSPAPREPTHGWLGRLRRRWRAWVARQQRQDRRAWPADLTPDDLRWIEQVHERSFAHDPYERLVHLWCGLASCLERGPLDLSEEQLIEELLEWSRDPLGCSEKLREFIVDETSGALPEKDDMVTVGSLLAFILRAEGDAIDETS